MKSIDSSKKLVTLALGFTGAFIFASQALAEEQSFTVKPFIFAEGVGKEFYLENVRTAHIVAATGLSLEYKPTSEDSMEATFGQGDFNIGGVIIDTKVSGVSYRRDVSLLNSWPFFIKAAYTTRTVAAEKTKVDKDSGKSLTDKLDSRLSTTDLLLGVSVSLTKYIHLKAATGLSRWHMKANIDDQLMISNFRATTYRVVNSKGTNAVHELGLEGGTDKWSLFLLMSQRSLGSKAEENIQGLSLGGSYSF